MSKTQAVALFSFARHAPSGARDARRGWCGGHLRWAWKGRGAWSIWRGVSGQVSDLPVPHGGAWGSWRRYCCFWQRGASRRKASV